MSVDAQQTAAGAGGRPDFVLPATAPGGAPVYEFFGSTVIQGTIIVGGSGPTAAQNEQAYLRQVADVYSVWRTQYILGPASAQGAPFVPGDSAALLRRTLGNRPGGGQLLRRPVALPEAIGQYRRVLLLGKPGSGKSSYLQYLALTCTLPGSGLAGMGLLPVLVDLSAYTSASPFLDFLRGFLRNPPNPEPPEAPFYVANPWLAGALEGYLQQGRILLLVDGLNELPGGLRADAAARRAQLAGFFGTSPARAVVACRMIDYDSELASANFQTVLLDDWTVDQMTAYLQGLGATLLLNRLRAGDPLLLSLGQVPYLLYMITELTANYSPPADGAGSAPQFLTSQSALFGQFVELLLDWATQRDQDNALLFPRRVVVTALARLAAAMQAAGYHGTAVAHDWATGQLPADARTLFAGLPPPSSLVGDPREHLLDFSCGATILDTPATRDTVRFWQLTHQDYFAALATRLGVVPPAPAGPAAPLAPANDEVNSLAAALAPQPAVAIAGILNSPDPRAPLVAAKALLSAGGA